MTFGETNVEWSEEIELLLEQLEEESTHRELSREEQAILDVIETVQLLEEGDGLHDFWQSGLDKNRIISSFDMVGSSTMVDMLNSTEWCAGKSEDKDDYSARETDYLSDIEEDLYSSLADLNDLVTEFIEDELGSF